MDEPLKILSLGAGVQSTTVLLMSCLGELPKLDAAIFSDTKWESKAVYEHFQWLKSFAESHGIPVHTVSKGNIKKDALVSQVRGKSEKNDKGEVISRFASMPYYTKNPDGSIGAIRRQCTSEYKIAPITKKLREIAGYGPRKRIPESTVEQWFGISVDEKHRATVSQKKWIDHWYPLIIEKRMNRTDCIKWLQSRFPGRKVPRSACLGCPFHDNTEWRAIRDESPDEWIEVVEFDRSIRNMGGRRGQVYLHRDCVPLEEVDFNTAEDEGQGSLFSQECTGMCGV